MSPLPKTLIPPRRKQRGSLSVFRAGHPQHIALTALAQVLAKPCVATQFIITGDPAVWHLIPPPIEHLQALLLPRLVANLGRYVAFLASLLIACPLLGQV